MFDDLDNSGEDEFDANELMNLGDYKGKRTQKLAPPKSLNINDVFDEKKKAAVNSQPVEESDDWGLNDFDVPDTKKVVMDRREA